MLAVLLLAGVGVVLWRVLGVDSPPDVGPEEVSLPRDPSPPGPRPEPPSKRPLAEKPRPAREGPFVAGEEFPPFGEGFAVSRRIYLPSTDPMRTVRGSVLSDAIQAMPDIYLRWESEEVKQAFLRTELRLSPDAGMDESEGRPAGAPIPSALMHLPEAGFRAWVRPPVVRIFALGTPNPDAPPR